MKFQGSGFEIDLPEDAMDASSYVFVANNGDESPPVMRISVAAVAEIPKDVQQFVERQLEAELAIVPGFKIIDQSSSKRENWHYGFATVQIGEGEGALREKRIFLFVDEDQPRLFKLVTTVQEPVSEKNLDYFAKCIRSFKPNDAQVLLPDVRSELEKPATSDGDESHPGQDD